MLGNRAERVPVGGSQTSNDSPSSDNNVKVCVRVRPSSSNEGVVKKCISVSQSNNAIILDCKPESKIFSYDYVADEYSSQEEIFTMIGKPITEAFMGGYNATVFAYGQTGSGKTFTIQGALTENGELIHENRGLIPRIFEYLFGLMKSTPNTTYSCKCSFLEIYNEQVTDLLEPSSTMMQIREDANRGVYVEGLREEAVDSASAAHGILLRGSTNRHVAYTTMNSASSRSHSMLTLSVQSRALTPDGLTNVRYSKLNLIDLAGSERQKSTNTAGARLKEAGNINKSLSALGNVIRALVDIADGKPRHVHYRDSKLTFLLKDSLGGNSKTCIVATISPSDHCFGETLSTLKFAQRAKLIQNTAIINEDVGGSVGSLQAEVRRLKELLAAQNINGGIPGSVSLGNTPAFERVRDLEVLLSKSLDETDELRKEISATEERIRTLTELCDRKDKLVLNTKMIIRLRENQLARVEQTSHSNSEENPEVEDLHEEITYLKTINAAHPDATRFALENLELRQQLNKFDEIDRNDEIVLKLHNQELAKQLRTLLHEKDALLDLVNKKGEKERWVEVQRMEEELNTVRRELDQEKLLRQANVRDLELQERVIADHERIVEENRKAYEHERGELLRMRLLENMEDGQGETKAQLSQMAESLQQIHTRCQQLESDLNTRDATIQQLREQLENASHANRRLSEAYHNELQEHTRASEDARMESLELQEFQKDIQKSDVLKREADSLREQLSSVREEHETLLEEVQYLRDQLRIQETPRENIDMYSQLQEYKAECDRLTEKLASHQEEKFETYMEIDSLKKQLSDEKDARMALSARPSESNSNNTVELEAVQSELCAAKQEVANLQSALQKQQAEREQLPISEYQHSINETGSREEHERETLRVELENARKSLLDSENLYREKELQYATLLQSTENARKTADSIRQEYEVNVSQLRETESRVDILNGDVERYILLQKETMEEKQALEKIVAELRHQNAKLIGHNNHKQKLQHHVKIKEENNTLLKENTRLTVENRRLQRELSKGRLQDSIAMDDTQNLSFSGGAALSNSTVNLSMHEDHDGHMSLLSKLQDLLPENTNKENRNNLNSSFDWK